MSERAMQGPLVILVVDDQAGIRRMLYETFTLAGHTVWLAAGGQQALALMRDKALDVALLDIRMPGMSGVDTLIEAKKIRPDLPMVLMTAYGEAETIETAARAGARHFIAKPFDIDEVRAVIELAVSEARRPLAAEAQAEYTPGDH